VSDISTFGWGPLRVNRTRLKQIMTLALPIIGGMGSQTLLNLVDTFMVSQLGKDAVAAVGLASFLNFLCIAFITGMSAGVQAMAARRKGEGRDSESAVPLNGGLLVVACLAIPLSGLFALAAPHMLSTINDDPAVIAQGTPYLQVRLIAMVAVGANFAFRGYWNGVNLSQLYLRTLVFMHLSNVAISYVLIFGMFGAPRLGTTGAATGTTISIFLGTVYYFYLGVRHARGSGFLRGLPGMDTIKTMLRLSVPSGIQQLFFAAGFTVLFTIIGMVGTNELAAANVVVNITMAAFLPGLGLGLAAASLVGQALGRRAPDDALSWGWDVGRVAMMLAVVVGLPMLLVPEVLLQAFFHDEPQALALAVWPLRLVGATIAVDVLGMVLLNAIIGAGATRLAMVVSVSAQWLVFLPAAYLVGPVLGFGLLGIWIAQILYRGGQTLLIIGIWRSRRWADIDV
jgi:multidrug resistance protein, MATE family